MNRLQESTCALFSQRFEREIGITGRRSPEMIRSRGAEEEEEELCCS